MYAIIEESGGQRKVVQGDEILIDLLEGGETEAGKTIKFDKVLMVGGDKARIGTPYVAGASISAEIVEPVVMGEKLTIQKFRAKKNSRRRTGHRQRYTKVRVTSINA